MILALKRILQNFAFLLTVAIIAVCIILCSHLKSDNGIPECGFVSGSDAMAMEISEKLENDGLIRYSSAEELKAALLRGEIDSGMVFPSDFSKRISDLDVRESITFYESERLTLATAYKYRTAAYIIEKYIPHLMAELLSREGVEMSPGETAAAINEYVSFDREFNFRFENASGDIFEVVHYSTRLVMGAISLLLFFAFSIFAVPYTKMQFCSLTKRIGVKKTLLHYSAPSVFFANALLFCGTAAALSLIGHFSLILPTAIYVLFLSALGIGMDALFSGLDKLRIPTIAVCIASFAACPIFIDISEFVNLPKWILHLIPTRFFYTACENPLAAFAVAIPLFFAACIIYVLFNKKSVSSKQN